MKPTLLVLAAGMGSRYGGLKQLDKLGPSGETILEYSVYDAIRAGFGKVVFVVRKNIEADFRAALGDKFSGKVQVEYVHQELDIVPEGVTIPADRVKPWGTGHAILMAKDVINEPFAVINADDFYGADAFKTISDFFVNQYKTGNTDYCMVGYLISKTLSDNGFVSRGVCGVDANNNLVEINERTHVQRIDGNIIYKDNDGNSHKLNEDDAVSMNFWGFTPDIFTKLEAGFVEFVKNNADNIKAEYFIPLLVQQTIDSNERPIRVLTSDAQWFGVTYQEDRPDVVNMINKLVTDNIYPSNLWE
ncbi:MAG: NTP transferase domain-containing protein [Bacteroidales bacterium]|nr:NTP transferase domain-containing protein [Bacteroidales bacterium]